MTLTSWRPRKLPLGVALIKARSMGNIYANIAQKWKYVKLETQQYEKYRLVLCFVLSSKEMRTSLNTFSCYKAYPQM
jgi:hypothetical protein